MKRNSILIFVLLLFSIVAGFLLSGISFVGRTGINLFYKEYKFLKVWWKGALLVFVIWMLLLFVQYLLSKRAGRTTSNFIHAIVLVIAMVGLYFSYADFRHVLSHRWLGERFHLGVYLFWIGWMAISIFLLTAKKDRIELNQINTLLHNNKGNGAE